MKQVKKRWPWHPKVPGEATVRNISKIALKIALLYSQTMSWEGCDVSLRRRRTVRYFYSFRKIFFLTPITVPRSVVGAGVSLFTSANVVQRHCRMEDVPNVTFPVTFVDSPSTT